MLQTCAVTITVAGAEDLNLEACWHLYMVGESSLWQSHSAMRSQALAGSDLSRHFRRATCSAQCSFMWRSMPDRIFNKDTSCTIDAQRSSSYRSLQLMHCCLAGADDLLFDLEEGAEDADAPAATLTSFTGSQSKPLSLSYSSSPEQAPSPLSTPRHRQLGMPIHKGPLFPAGSYQDSQASSNMVFGAFQPPMLASSAATGSRWPRHGQQARRQGGRSRKHGARLRPHNQMSMARKQVGPAATALLSSAAALIEPGA